MLDTTIVFPSINSPVQRLKRYARQQRYRVCRKRAKPNFQPSEFHLEKRSPYQLFGWGTFPGTASLGTHYLRVRRFERRGDSCVPTGMPQRAALARVLLDCKAERRTPNTAILATMLERNPTHVLRLGWAAVGHHDILYVPLCFALSGWHTDGLATAFGDRMVEVLHRNHALTWYMCPSTRGDATAIAALFWFGAAFTCWVEGDLGMQRIDG